MHRVWGWGKSRNTEEAPRIDPHSGEFWRFTVRGGRGSKAESCTRKGWDAESEESQNRWAEFERKQVQDSESSKPLHNTQSAVLSSLHEPTYFTQHPHTVDRLLSSSWKWSNWGPERLSSLSRVTQPRFEPRQAGSSVHMFKQQARPETWTWTFHSTLSSTRRNCLKIGESISAQKIRGRCQVKDKNSWSISQYIEKVRLELRERHRGPGLPI